jgi:hypothetical protein
MERQMTKITLSRSFQGWQAIFEGETNMPKNTPLPLPFTFQASPEMVKADLRSRFPQAVFVVKAGSR